MCRRPPAKPNEAPFPRAAHLLDGDTAEDQALAYLEQQGLSLLARNYRCRAGEIDLVMRQGGELVIVEIRYRRDESPVTALETITRQKQRRIARATQHYLLCHPQLSQLGLRFDVVALSGPLQRATLDWRQAAFDCTGLPGL